jgi:23S rRNA (guanosine2251-2'-O)-methyltransferase
MIVYGKQVFLHILKKHPKMIEEVYLTKDVDKKLFSQVVKTGKKIVRLDFIKAQSLARGGNHQGFLMKISDVGYVPFELLKKETFLLVLVGLTDVGNIGAIVRSAYALGVQGIVLSGVKTMNLEGVVRSSTGAILDMPMALVSDTATLINELKQQGFKIYAADMDGEDAREITFVDKKVLLLGSEGMGIPKRILKSCDTTIKVAMEREFDSLNVSAAAAILCDRMR